jgi:hypothetical protein
MLVSHTLADGRVVKLGKWPARHDSRTLQLAKYTAKVAPAPPAHDDWEKKVRHWPMMKNDVVGDCTCACAGHMIEQWTTYSQAAFTPTDQQVIAAYSAITGYDPSTGNNDDGAAILDVLNYWRNTGVAGHKILAFTTLDPSSRMEVEDSVFLFGNCYLGVQLPVSAQYQTVWAVPPGGATGPGAAGSWGGHAIPVVAYDQRGLTVVTWGALKRMTWGFFYAYCDEAYAVLSQNWISHTTNLAASGFDLAALEKDLRQIAQPLPAVLA